MLNSNTKKLITFEEKEINLSATHTSPYIVIICVYLLLG